MTTVEFGGVIKPKAPKTMHNHNTSVMSSAGETEAAVCRTPSSRASNAVP